MITVYQQDPCWTLTGRRDEGHEHFNTEAEALRQVARDFTDDPGSPGEFPGRYSSPCWIVVCDATVCGEVLVDIDEEFTVHFDLPAEAITELAWQRAEFGADGWCMTPDGLTWCPEHRPEDLDQVPVPLTHAEQVDAGQGCLL